MKMIFLSIGLVVLALLLWGTVAHAQDVTVKPAYVAKDFTSLIGMPGFSETLLRNHFKLYQGYVTNTNNLLTKLQDLLNEGKEKTPDYAEMKRRLGWEFDGMRLHEYYFANLGGKSSAELEAKFADKISKDFGSFELWKKDFMATGSMRGIGWVVLYEDPMSGRFMNMWINEHDVGHPAGAKPILVMDVFEHAYMLDYQLDRPKYLEAFFNAINWEEVLNRI
jgi:superoxide dismutase, Fe-Mn family